MDDKGTRHVSFYLTEKEHQKVRISAIKRGLTLRNLFREMIWAWFKWIAALEKSEALSAGDLPLASELDKEIAEATAMLEQLRAERGK